MSFFFKKSLGQHFLRDKNILERITTIKRIKDNKKRPLVLNLKINEIKKLIDERSKIYISSDYKINCDKLDKFEIVKKIKDIYEGS